MHQCKLHEREKKAFIYADPLWLLHGIGSGTNNGGHHVAIMANAHSHHMP